jgi:hypothetical protein
MSIDRRSFLARSATAAAAAGIAAGCDAVAPSGGSGSPQSVAALTVWDFARVVGEPFSLTGPGDAPATSVQLVDVLHRGAPYAPSWREPFSVFFKTSAPLAEGLYTVEHPATGRHTLFLAPTGPSHELEAVFT